MMMLSQVCMHMYLFTSNLYGDLMYLIINHPSCGPLCSFVMIVCMYVPYVCSDAASFKRMHIGEVVRVHLRMHIFRRILFAGETCLSCFLGNHFKKAGMIMSTSTKFNSCSSSTQQNEDLQQRRTPTRRLF